MTLTLLGGLELEESSFGRPKPLVLLAYLALEGPRDRRHLARLFWPHAASPAGSLSKALGQLRQGAGEVIVEEGGLLRGLTETDAHAFLAALDGGRDREAVDRYRGPFLAGLDLDLEGELEGWVLRQRERLADLQRSALIRLGEAAAAEGDAAAAGRYAQMAYFLRAAPEPGDEELARLHTLLHAAGDPLAKEVRREAAAFGLELSSERSEPASAAEVVAEVVGPEPELDNPYRGLAFFREEDAPFFFGREPEAEELAAAVARAPYTVALVGPSGSGKSSLVFAGLVPALRRAGGWEVASFRPGREPFLALALALMPLLDATLSEVERLREAGALARSLRDNELTLSEAIERLLQARPEGRVLLIVDQFEELYTVSEGAAPAGRGEEGTRTFLTQLLSAIDRADDRFSLVLTLRADFMEAVLEFGPFVELLQGSQLLLGPMSREGLRRAIEEPAAEQGVALEDGLTERMLQEVDDQAGSLPLLEFALSQLWDARRGGRLTHQAYDAIGGVENALARHAERAFAALGPDEQVAAQRVFLQLVYPGEGREDTRRVAIQEELGEHWSQVRRLASAQVRLVVTGRDESGHQTAEVIHEALIRRWRRLRGWLDEHRGFRSWQERLRQEVHLWLSLDRDDGALLRGFRLDEALEQRTRYREQLGADEVAFVAASLALRERERAAEERRLQERQRARREREMLRRRVTRVLAAGLAVAVMVSGLALWQWRAAGFQRTEAQRARAAAVESQHLAEEQRDLAERQADLALARQLSAQALVAAQLPGATNGYYDRAALLAGEAHRLAGDDLQGYGALLRVMQSVPPRLYGYLHSGGASLSSLAFSPDGRSLAGGDAESALLLWNVADLQPSGAELAGHDGGVRSVAYSPDGTLLASGSRDGTVRLWNVAARAPLGEPLAVHSDEVLSVAFSPDGSLLASGGRDGLVVLWSVAEQRQVSTLQQERAFPVSSVAFSPDGSLLAVGNRDNSVVLWDVATRTTLGEPLRGHDDQVRTVAFSPDGTLLASGSRDGTLVVWDLAAGSAVTEPLRGHDGEVRGVAFSPDGALLVSGGSDGALALWSTADWSQVGPPLAGHPGEVRGVAFSPDGALLASGGSDGTVLLWRFAGGTLLAEPLEELGGGGEVWSVAFAPDGAQLASGGRDGVVRLWELEGDPVPSDSSWRHGDEVRSVAYSPDGTLVASGGRDGTVRLWRADGGEALDAPLRGHDGWVRTVAFSPDGTLLASGGRDGTVRLWNTTSGAPAGEPLLGHGDEARSVAFSPDGSLLASGSSDGTVRLWDVASGAQAGAPLLGHDDWVMAVAFAPDGSLLASAGRDGTVRLWDMVARAPLGAPLLGHHDEVLSVAFAPDGGVLASGDRDGSVLLWDVAAGTPLAEPLHAEATEVWALAFDPASGRLAAGGRGGINLWNIDSEGLVAGACRLAGRNLGEVEWERYLGAIPYRALCPGLPIGV